LRIPTGSRSRSAAIEAGGALRDPRYDALHDRIALIEQLSVPALMIQGAADACVLPQSTESKDKYFSRGYRCVVLEGIGHFPAREAPDAVADAVLEFLS
jgi:pimeloyl-ACP methyl ester carboxylesterase